MYLLSLLLICVLVLGEQDGYSQISKGITNWNTLEWFPTNLQSYFRFYYHKTNVEVTNGGIIFPPVSVIENLITCFKIEAFSGVKLPSAIWRRNGEPSKRWPNCSVKNFDRFIAKRLNVSSLQDLADILNWHPSFWNDKT